jgi:N-sulfoglucosamine sulfohydrolase
MTQWRRETADHTPEKLTGDWYDRKTGKKLRDNIRGVMPGSQTGAVHTTEKGPY